MNFSIDEILNGLNDEQKKAVRNIEGSMFLIAGPGSGKTRVLVERTKYMIAMGKNPENILLFTFTNKAAKEIKQRISNAVGSDIADKITTGTYHSFCCRLLRQYAGLLGYNNGFSILDADDAKKIATRLLDGTNILSKDLISYISSKKRKLITAQEALQEASSNNDQLAVYYEKYETELFNQNCMDFDNLLINAIKLLQRNPSVLAEVNEKYKYISADEFQDSSLVDICFMELMAGANKNICLVGDEDQSIYSFRGADVEAVMSVKHIFPNLQMFYLNQNYRSSDVIVKAARSVIENNDNRFDKNMFTDNNEGQKIMIFEEKNQKLEAVRIAKTIELLVSKHHYKYKDVAILYRASALSRPVEEVFLKMKIPYSIVSGINFYQRKEIKDIIAYLKFIENPYDIETFTRAISFPKRGVGESSIDKVIDFAKSTLEQMDLYTASKQCIDNGLIKGKARKGLENFCSIEETIASLRDHLTVPDLIREVLKQTDYYKYLEAEYDGEADDRISNIMELIEISYTANDLTEFLSSMSLASNQDIDDTNDGKGHVQMMTMHMSKGLEFPIVFLMGANEGTIPFQKALSNVKAISEERRLFFVGMTRAERQLFITRSKAIQQRGSKFYPQMSRFVNEINGQYVYMRAEK